MIEVARWTEEAGFKGILTHTDNASLDPWAAAQLIIENTETLVPIVAVNPIYMHPLSTARMINTIAFLYGRRVDLNLVSGGFARHLRAAGCTLDHDQRYDRLAEYAEALRMLLGADKPVSHRGSHYELKSAALSPALPPDMTPGFFMSGASDAARNTQERLGVTRLAYPREIGTYQGPAPLHRGGVGWGVIARDTAEEAWAVARRRFPIDRQGEKIHDFASAGVQSRWHQNLSEDAVAAGAEENAYWLYPFRSYRAFSPYLVGSHAEVAGLLSRYFALGVSTVVLDVDGTLEEADLHHTRIAFDLVGGKES
ncbi:LLM class flavin-dependent oxidoreductase [Actinoplanes couchii]|uniref:Oxidoreductase n=1 Tax=Actinoplanes couchii TaxID=403638 RepID=A0ABQ3XBT3_9ACTN|nr:oxidoreductase [Actinoplanes couchii]